MAKMTEVEKARRARNRRHTAALKAEEEAIRQEEKWREWDEKGMRLTWEEFAAGLPCRGCGLPIKDGRGGWPALLHMDDKQREEYEAEQADFRRRHPDCNAHRWSASGSSTTHCGFCCPPPPLSQEQIEAIAPILARIPRKVPPAELATWQLTLTCDHVIEKPQHRSNTHWSGQTTHCPDCQQTRGIITSERLQSDPAPPATEQRRMAEQLAKARAEHERLQKKADAARQRMNKLENELADHNKDQ